MQALLNGDRLILGTCYYPEHWDESLWREDLTRMLKSGIEVIRIAEFAWSKVEPTEGNFTFDFFDRFLDLAYEMGMKVIFSTPTATPPAWLTSKYPEVLNADIQGNLYKHGMRRHYNYNSPKYLELTEIIVTKFASHYAKHPAIIGWQIDNEINCERDIFYSESDTLAFRAFVQKKYGSLDALNKAWGTTFWNQTYTAWEEIDVPRYTYQNSTNPHLTLDYIRFVSASARAYVKLQSDILRKYVKEDDFITTNGMFGHLDNHAMNEESLDFYMYDSYPNFAFCLDTYQKEATDLRDRNWSKNLAEVRSISGKFGIMEQQSGANGWNTRMAAPTPRPGQMTLWTMQSIAHGADYISYFRWRTATMGTEIYWHGILDYSGRENRRLREVDAIHEKLQKMKDVAGAKYEAKVGIIRDYDNIWDAELDVWHGYVHWASEKALFEAMEITHTPFDYVYLNKNLTLEQMNSYQVLFYPHATIVTKEQAELLEQYVKQGGTLVIGCRSGYKNSTGQCVMEKLPGLLAPIVGTDIPEYSLIAPDAKPTHVLWEDSYLEASVFADILEPVGEKATVLASYADDYYAGSAALICNKLGKGKAFYYGSAWNQASARVFLEKLGVAEPYANVVSLPETCEIAIRKKGDDERYLFILNYSDGEQELFFHKPVYDLLTGKELSGVVSIGQFSTLVAKM